MTQEQFDYLSNKANELMNKTKDASHDWRHVETVKIQTLKIKKLLSKEKQNQIDDQILTIACLWHDISYVYYQAGLIHYFLEAGRGAKIAKKYFNQVGLNKEEIKLISDVISRHHLAYLRCLNKKRSLYHQIVQDADFLEGLFNQERLAKAKELAKESWYWKLVIKILKPLFFNFYQNKAKYFVNLKESLEIVTSDQSSSQ